MVHPWEASGVQVKKPEPKKRPYLEVSLCSTSQSVPKFCASKIYFSEKLPLRQLWQRQVSVVTSGASSHSSHTNLSQTASSKMSHFNMPCLHVTSKRKKFPVALCPPGLDPSFGDSTSTHAGTAEGMQVEEQETRGWNMISTLNISRVKKQKNDDKWEKKNANDKGHVGLWPGTPNFPFSFVCCCCLFVFAVFFSFFFVGSSAFSVFCFRWNLRFTYNGYM